MIYLINYRKICKNAPELRVIIRKSGQNEYKVLIIGQNDEILTTKETKHMYKCIILHSRMRGAVSYMY